MQNTENQNVQSGLAIRPGAVRFMFMERTMKMYCIHESELNNLSLLDTWVNFLLAISGFSLGIIASILTNWIGQDQSMGLNSLSVTVIIIFAGIAVTSLGFALWMIISKKAQIEKIGATSKIISDSIRSTKDDTR